MHELAKQPRPIMGSSRRKGQSLQTHNFKSILTRFISLRHLVLGWQVTAFICTQPLAKSRIKHTANIIYIIMTDSKNMAGMN